MSKVNTHACGWTCLHVYLHVHITYHENIYMHKCWGYLQTVGFKSQLRHTPKRVYETSFLPALMLPRLHADPCHVHHFRLGNLFVVCFRAVCLCICTWRCCYALSSEMAHFALKCNKIRYAYIYIYMHVYVYANT